MKAFFSLIAICLYLAPATAQPKVADALYSAEMKRDGETYCTVFDQEGNVIFKESRNSVYCNSWNWIFIIDKASGLKKAYNSKGHPFKIGPIEKTQDASASDELIGLRRNGLWGFYDKRGRKCIDHLYDEVSAFHKGLALVKIKEETFFIDVKGKRAQGPDLEGSARFIYAFGGMNFAIGYAIFTNKAYKVVEREGKKGLEDSLGNLLIPCVYDGITNLKEKPGLVIVKKTGKYGVVSVDNKVIIPVIYSDVYHLNPHVLDPGN